MLRGSGEKSSCSGQSGLLGGGGLVCDRWRGAGAEGAGLLTARAAAPRLGREGRRPLQAAARRDPERPGARRRAFAAGCGAEAFSARSFHPALRVQRLSVAPEAHKGCLFPSGRAQPSFLLVSCFQCQPCGVRGSPFATSASAARTSAASTLRAPPREFPGEKPGSRRDKVGL